MVLLFVFHLVQREREREREIGGCEQKRLLGAVRSGSTFLDYIGSFLTTFLYERLLSPSDLHRYVFIDGGQCKNALVYINHLISKQKFQTEMCETMKTQS